MFQPVDGNVNFPEQELAVGKFWKEHGIYEKSLAQRQGAPPFVFYEGPPTANGMPHPGHCLTRAIKDLFPRYRTMRGYLCERKAGWDTHGLPVEVEVCKELGIHSKEEIEAYGIEPFIQQVPGKRLALHAGVGAAHRAARLLGRPRRGVRHVPPELRRKRLVVAQEPVRPRAAVPGPQDRLVVGPGRHGALSGEVGQGYAKWPTRACMCGFRCWIDDGQARPTRACWSGRRRPGRCRAISSRRCIRSWNTAIVRRRRTAGQADRRHRRWSKTIAGKVEARADESNRPVKGSELIGRRYVPPFDYYYKIARRAQTGAAASRRRQRAHLPGASSRPTSSRPTAAPASCIKRRRLAKSISTCLSAEQARFVDGARSAADLRRRPRRQVHRRSARLLQRPLGQGLRQGHHPRPEAARAALSTRSNTCTTIRSAGGPKKIR